MTSNAFMTPSWLALLVSFLFVSRLSTTCLAQDNVSSAGDPTVTAAARNPDPSSSTANQPATTTSVPAQTHTIQVGLADHKFRPEVTEAKVGDTIEFRFYPKNHSVVRAEYGFPCIPYEMTGSNKEGFFTGFNAVDAVLDDPPKYTLTVKDTNPIFFYCSAPGSCLTYGMVGAINPNSSTKIDTQHQLALDSSYMLNPGEPFPAESPLPSSNPASTSVPTGSQTGKKGLSAGAIAGIVIASLSVVVLAALLFFFWGRTKTLKDEVDRKSSTITRRISPSSSSAMLEAGRRNGGAGEETGIYQHYTTSPTPYSPQQQQQKYPGTNTSPIDYHAYSPATYSPSPADATLPRRAASLLSPGSTIPDLRPTTASYPHSSLVNNDDMFTSQHALLHRPLSPHSLAAQDAKLGPYGQQVMTNEPAPSYFETVHRPGPVHVNGQIGPAEMEGSSAVRERPRWEEVGAEGKMF